MYMTVNIEQNMPTAPQAVQRLEQELRRAKASHRPALKIIHGYGSTGQGGVIKREVHRVLSQKKRLREIKTFVKGEEFTPFHSAAREAIAFFPELGKDSDYTRGNPGVTIIVF